MSNEIAEWLHETRNVFPKLDRKIILADYKKMSNKKLGYVKTKIEQRLEFNPESLLLGKDINIKNKRLKPSEFYVYINQDLKKIKNIELQKEVVQNILIHELLHIESEDLLTLSKNYNKRKKKKIHVNDFEEEIFERYNKLREIKGIKRIEKRKYLDIAINKILESISWNKK